jgi:hypothetical protein
MSSISSIAVAPAPHQAAPVRGKMAQYVNHGPQVTKDVKASHPKAAAHEVSRPTETKGNHVNIKA